MRRFLLSYANKAIKLKSQYIRLVLLMFLLSISILGNSQNSTSQQTYKIEKNILYRDEASATTDDYIAERCRLDIYYPSDTTGFTTVIWFHGGALTHGEKYIPENLKQKGIAVVAVTYRFSPKVQCPEYIDDAAAATAWVFKNINAYGGDPAKIVVSGHSAGGYLASMIGLDKKWLSKYDIDANNIAMLIPFSGHTITHMTIRKERGIPEEQPIVDEYAPLYHVRKDAPPLILITGDRELELLGRYEENAYLWRMMKIVGHDKVKLYELDSFNHNRMVSPATEILLEEIKQLN